MVSPVVGDENAIRFTEVAKDAGVDFRHVHGGSGVKFEDVTAAAGLGNPESETIAGVLEHQFGGEPLLSGV